MKKYNALLLLILGTLITACGEAETEKNSGFSIKFAQNDAEFQLRDTLKASIANAKALQIDSVQYFFKNEKIETLAANEPLQWVIQPQKLGKYPIKAVVFSDGEQFEVVQDIQILNNEKPVTYSYKVINTYPHDPQAYTQGLEFHNDTLYESTGQYGQSSLRKVDWKTGEVLQKVTLDDKYFAEGLTILNNKIYQLTWREGEGFIYDVNSLEKTGSFAYNQSKEGWGLAHGNNKIYKSDGTEKIWILNPETLAEEDYIQVATHSAIVAKMNELEWINGKIYANTYQKDGVAIINPETGAIEGLIDFRGLRDQLGNVAELDPQDDVLNGIAYNPNTNKIYVTGKNWDKLFEVEIVEK